MSSKKLLEDCLQKLSDDQFESFINKLLDREDPGVSEEQVKGRGRLEVVEVMVNVFSEEKFLDVAAETLRQANLDNYANELAGDAAAGVNAEPDAAADQFVLSPPKLELGHKLAESLPMEPPGPLFESEIPKLASEIPTSKTDLPVCPVGSSVNIKYRHRDPWSNIHSSAFVEKYRMKLIQNVPDADPLLDVLLHQKVLSGHSHSEIKALPTDGKKMSKLLMGPYLKTKTACDIFYNFLKEQHPHLVLNLLQN